MLSTLIQIMFVILSMRIKRYSGLFLFLANVLLIPRQTFRLLDFEGTKEYLEPEYFNFLVIIQGLVLYICLCMLFNGIESNKLMMAYAFVQLLFGYYCILAALYGNEKALSASWANIPPMSLMLLIIYYKLTT
jgi:hypothetical protein